MKPEKIRLQKFLANQGVASRRAVEKMIEEGRIAVNGQHAKLGAKVIGTETITINGKRFKASDEAPIIIAFHKPKGVISTMADENREKETDKTLADFDFGVKARLYPVGRLDKDSRGLLLMTNDGQLANKLSHPSHEHEKEYLVTLESEIKDAGLRRLSNGTLTINDEKVQKAKVERKAKNKFSIILKEGKNRQIRKMCGIIGVTVVDLKRTRIADIKLEGLPSGESKKAITQLG